MHEVVIIIAKYLIALSALLTLLTWFTLERRLKLQFVCVLLASAILAVLFAKIGGHLFYDPRPFVVGHFTPYFYHANDNGFPSDHSLLAATLAFVSLRYNRVLGGIILILGLLIGSSRIIAGVHHTIDVIGAFAISAAAVGLAVGVQLYLARKTPKETHAPSTGS